MAKEDFSQEWKEGLLKSILKRPSYMIEVRRDGKDDAVIEKLICDELNRRLALPKQKKIELEERMREYAAASWKTAQELHMLMLDDDKPENEKQRLDPDHWYEINLTNAVLFSNLDVVGMPELVPGRLFSTRMPRNLVNNENDKENKNKWKNRCKKNKLEVICVLTEPYESQKYSGMDGLLKDFYAKECGLIVYNRPIPDFQIPTSGELVNNILDLTYHLSQGQNCLIHCAGGSGRTGMVIAAIVKNLGLYDPIARIRRVKSTYVETPDQELFLRDMPKVIDKRILEKNHILASAIAAEHLIQVFYTNGECMEKSQNAKNVVKGIDGKIDDVKDAQVLIEAYKKTFDLIDTDGSGCLDAWELKEWLHMCDPELDLRSLFNALLKEGNLKRDRFANLMCSYANSSRRDYDIGGIIKPHSH